MQEAIAREAALNRVLEHLGDIDKHPGIDPEFYNYQVALVEGEISNLEIEIDRLKDEYPNLQTFISEQLREELLAIEADTYAEFVRAGRLNQELSLFLGVENMEE